MARIRIKITRPAIKVTKSGRLFCNHCGTWNQAHVGMTNPICGRCGKPLA